MIGHRLRGARPDGRYLRTHTSGDLALDVFERRGAHGQRFAGRTRTRTYHVILAPAWAEYRFASESECVAFHLGNRPILG